MTRGCAVVLLFCAAGACAERDPANPAEASARGDALMRKVSDTLHNASDLSFTVSESHERLRRNGQKEPYSVKRQVVMRRPNQLWSRAQGADERDVTVVYDGKAVTVIGNVAKVYATVKAPPSLDETLDLISERYDLRLSAADFLYSSPYESFAGSGSTGGWVKRVNIDGVDCEEMSYSASHVDFILSVTAKEPVLPCQAEIVFKNEPGQPHTKMAFSNWNLHPQIDASQFAAAVPDGYELIPIVERIPKSELKEDAAKAMGAAK